jgi:hypothetical protein
MEETENDFSESVGQTHVCDSRFIQLDQVYLRTRVRLSDNSVEACDWVLRGQLSAAVREGDEVEFAGTVLRIVIIAVLRPGQKTTRLASAGPSDSKTRVLLGLRTAQRDQTCLLLPVCKDPDCFCQDTSDCFQTT